MNYKNSFEYCQSYKSCYLVAVGKKASATGYTIIGHNEDDGGERVKMDHAYVKPMTWSDGYILPAEKGLAGIPQVKKTFGYFWSECREARGGYSVTDALLNDNGVYIVSNNSGTSKEDKPDLTEGGISQNIRRIVAERAKSARDAVDIIIELVSKYGYARSGRCYTVADKNDIWIIQIVKGKHYVACRVPDDHVSVMPNHYTIHDINEYKDVIYSDDIIEYALKRGWYMPKVENDYSDFKFAEAYQDKSHYKIPYNTYRHGYGLRLLGYDFGVDENGYYPFSVKAKNIITVDKVRELLSYHFEGTEHDKQRIAPGNNPHDCCNMPEDIGYRRICTGYTTESSICQMTDDVDKTTLWLSYGQPCVIPHVPLHPLIRKIPETLTQIKDTVTRLEYKFEPNYQLMTYDEYSACQKLKDFKGLMDMVYEKHIDDVRKIINEYMNRKYKENEKMIKTDYDKLFDFDNNSINEAVKMLQNYADKNIIMVDIECENIDIKHKKELVDIVFRFKNTKYIPVEDSIKFGMGLLDTNVSYSKAIKNSLIKTEDETWKISFPYDEIVSHIYCAGIYEHFIGGITNGGNVFTGMIKIPFV